MRVAELKSLARERGLRGYSRLRKSGLIDLIRNILHPQFRNQLHLNTQNSNLIN